MIAARNNFAREWSAIFYHLPIKFALAIGLGVPLIGQDGFPLETSNKWKLRGSFLYRPIVSHRNPRLLSG